MWYEIKCYIGRIFIQNKLHSPIHCLTKKTINWLKIWKNKRYKNTNTDKTKRVIKFSLQIHYGVVKYFSVARSTSKIALKNEKERFSSWLVTQTRKPEWPRHHNLKITILPILRRNLRQLSSYCHHVIWSSFRFAATLDLFGLTVTSPSNHKRHCYVGCPTQ